MLPMSYFIKIIMCLVISTCSADLRQCNVGWHLQNGSCYSYGESTVSWADAQDMCRIYGGKLAEIESQDENNFVKNLVKDKLSYQTWIGGTDILNEGHWEWISSGLSINTFTDWGQGQPDNVNGEDCLQYSKDFAYQWNDFPCSSVANFVCEAESTGLITG